METSYLGNGGAAIEQSGERHGQVSRIARQLDIGPEPLRHWVRQAEIDQGRPPERHDRGAPTDRGAREGEPRAPQGQPDPEGSERVLRSGARSAPETARSSRSAEVVSRSSSCAGPLGHRRRPTTRHADGLHRHARSPIRHSPRRSRGSSRRTTTSLGCARSGTSCAAKGSRSARIASGG